MRGISQTPKAAAPPSPVPTSCPHYQRSCLLQCNVCKEFVTCRICHSEMDRFKVALLKCMHCNTTQPPSAVCIECAEPFAAYCCTICHTYDSTPGKLIFHCVQCGICRVGTRDTTHHCERCDMCIVINTNEGRQHECFANTWRTDCPACLEHLWDSRDAISMLQCGHAMHSHCFRTLLQTEYRCPSCKKATVDMTDTWEETALALEQQLTEVVASGQFPPELLTRPMRVLCNECESKFDTTFNPFVMYKCPLCNGFNTSPCD